MRLVPPLAALAASLLVHGCATYYRVPQAGIAAEVPPDIVILVASETPNVEGRYEPSNGLIGAGLIGALVDASIELSRRDAALEKVRPLDEHMHEWAYGAFEDALRAEFAPLSDSEVRIVEQFGSAPLGELGYDDTGACASLLLRTRFRLSSDMARMQLEVFATGHRVGQDGRLFYRNRIFAECPCYLQLYLGKGDDSLPPEALVAFRKSLERIAGDVAKLLAYDLSASSPGTESPVRAAHQPEGTVFRDLGDRAWLRGPRGDLISSPQL